MGMISELVDISKHDMEEVRMLASPRPWTYHREPSGTFDYRDWIEDAAGNIVVNNVGHLDGPLICDAVNKAEK